MSSQISGLSYKFILQTQKETISTSKLRMEEFLSRDENQINHKHASLNVTITVGLLSKTGVFRRY